MSDIAPALPSHATPLERALVTAAARACDLPVPIRQIWDTDTCPVALLPYLAWSLGVPTWNPEWPDNVKRARIRAAIQIHKRKGTSQSVRDVVNSFGAGVALREWWETEPRGTPMTFKITVSVGAGAPQSAGFQREILKAVDEAKRAAAQYELIAGVEFSGAIGVVGAFQALKFGRTELTGNAEAARSGQDSQATAPLPPTAAFDVSGPDEVGQAQSFDASASSGSGLSYAWTFGDGSIASGSTVEHTYASADDYTVTLTVTDSANQIDSVAKTVSIDASAPAAPVAVFAMSGPKTVGKAQTFDGSNSTGSGLSYAWAFGDGSNASGETIDHAYNNAGSYTATLTVTDRIGRNDSASRTFSVAKPLPAAPVAAFSVGDDPTVGQSITFDASSSTGDGLTYTWSFDDSVTGTGVQTTHAYSAAGDYSVALEITDSAGQADRVTQTVTVAEAAPNAPTAAIEHIGKLTAGKTQTFDASDSTGDALSYAWTLPDGSTQTGITIEYAWQSAGNRTVSLTVTDSAGQTATASRQYDVAADPRDAAVAVVGSDAGLIFDAAERSSLFYERDAISANDGVDAPIGRVVSLAGTDQDATAVGASDAARPMLRGAGDRRWLEFDGINNALVHPPAGYSYTATIAMRPTDYLDDHFWDQGTRIEAGYLANTSFYLGSNHIEIPLSVGTDTTLTIVVDGGNVTVYQDGGLVATGSAGGRASNAETSSIGCSITQGTFNGTNGNLGNFAGLRLYAAARVDRALDDSERAAFEAFVNDRRGAE